MCNISSVRSTNYMKARQTSLYSLASTCLFISSISIGSIIALLLILSSISGPSIFIVRNLPRNYMSNNFNTFIIADSFITRRFLDKMPVTKRKIAFNVLVIIKSTFATGHRIDVKSRRHTIFFCILLRTVLGDITKPYCPQPTM